MNLGRWGIPSSRGGSSRLSRCVPCPPLAKVSSRQSLPRVSESRSPRCGCASPQPGERAEPAGSEVHVSPGSLAGKAAEEEEARAGRRVGQGPHPGMVRGYPQRWPQQAEARESGKEVSTELSAGCLPCASCTTASTWNRPGQRQRRWVRAAHSHPCLPRAAQAAPSALWHCYSYSTGTQRGVPKPTVSALPALGDPRGQRSLPALPAPQRCCGQRLWAPRALGKVSPSLPS